MDTPDLEGSMRAFSRILRPKGVAILVFSHPCFPAGGATLSGTGGLLAVAHASCQRSGFSFQLAGTAGVAEC